MNIIHTKNLTKTFRRFKKEPGLKGSVKSLFNRKFVDKTAVSEFDLSINSGEFIGLIGPNGAGKTTLVKMLTGIIAPTSGELSVLGHYPNKLENTFKMQYAIVMGQKSQLFFELTPVDTFQLFKVLYNIPDEVYKYNIEYFVNLFDISDFLNVQVRTLSLGERMKMELVVALLHNPSVLFLDEPTIGLDATAQRQIRTFLKEVNEQKGTTIILTSHYMEDVKSLCPRSVVINNGKKLYDGSTEQLFNSYQTDKKITISFDTATDFSIPTNAKLLGENQYKISLLVPKEKISTVIKEIMIDYSPMDISVEDDDIGTVVERIYSGGDTL